MDVDAAGANKDTTAHDSGSGLTLFVYDNRVGEAIKHHALLRRQEDHAASLTASLRRKNKAVT